MGSQTDWVDAHTKALAGSVILMTTTLGIPRVSTAAQGHLHRLFLSSLSHPQPQVSTDTPEEARVHTDKWSPGPFPPSALLYLPARLGGHFKRGLECSPLLGRQDGSGALGALVVLAVLSTSLPSSMG